LASSEWLNLKVIGDKISFYSLLGGIRASHKIMSKEFNKLTPFEKTVLLEIARAQALASAAFQVASAAPGEKIPPPKEILQTALDAQILGMLETLKKNQ
jgi:hypothetical protein